MKNKKHLSGYRYFKNLKLQEQEFILTCCEILNLFPSPPFFLPLTQLKTTICENVIKIIKKRIKINISESANVEVINVNSNQIIINKTEI